MLIDIGNDILMQEGFHMGRLFAVVLDRRGVESSFVSAFIADFTGMLDVVYRLVEEPGRNSNDFLEVFFVRGGGGELETIETRFHTILNHVRSGQGTVGSQENIWRFKVFFQPTDSGDQSLGIGKTLPDVKGSNLDDPGLSYFSGYALE